MKSQRPNAHGAQGTTALVATFPCNHECRRVSHGSIRRVSRDVKRWKSPDMIRRWSPLGVVAGEKKFRRLKGYREMEALRRALREVFSPLTPARTLRNYVQSESLPRLFSRERDNPGRGWPQTFDCRSTDDWRIAMGLFENSRGMWDLQAAPSGFVELGSPFFDFGETNIGKNQGK